MLKYKKLYYFLFQIRCHVNLPSLLHAPVAQLDRALASGAKGRTFKSSRAHQFLSTYLISLHQFLLPVAIL